VKDTFIFCAFVFAAIAFFVAADTIRSQAARIYDLEMRIFYLEDVVGYYFYGPDLSEQYQTDFSGGEIK
jgi:hypothetical protein